MSYNFSQLKEKGQEVIDWIKKEYQSVRTGRASVSVLDNVIVESYGSKMPIKQLATITVEDSKTLMVTPWDTSQKKALEKAISDNDLGLSVNVGDTSLRVSFPDLTSERRESMVKLINQKEEQGKVSLRQVREEIWDDIQNKEKSGEITEDEKFRYKEEMQKIIDDFTKQIEEIARNKEEEIKG